jgi:hypothetical protein
MFFTATWSLGYAALVVAVLSAVWAILSERHKASVPRAAQLLLAASTVLLWINLVFRFVRGRGWPLNSPADLAGGIALILLTLYLGWSTAVRRRQAIWFVTLIALALLTYVLVKQPPTGMSTQPLPSPGVRAGTVLNLIGGALLALAAAASLTIPVQGPAQSAQALDPTSVANDRASEAFVRIALFCLAMRLAIDTWWLQKVGLGNVNDAQQAGIAVAWMVYFGALRLRAQPDWKGWPWTAVVSVGFFCTLPILLNVPWLETTLAL